LTLTTIPSIRPSSSTVTTSFNIHLGRRCRGSRKARPAASHTLNALHELPSPSSDFDGTPTPRSLGGSDDEAAGTHRCWARAPPALEARLRDGQLSETTSSDNDGSHSAEDRATQSEHWMGGWKMSMSAPASSAATWGPYFNAEFGPSHRVREWISWKISSTGVNIARRHWDQREELRAAYEAVHGTDPHRWPNRHPGIVIDAVPWIAHPACLGCQWIDMPGTSMRDAALREAPGWREAATAVAQRHESSNGQFRGETR
jgi:hypothetical protein